MNPDPKLFDVPVDGGNLRVARWGESGPIVLAAHGITAAHLNFRAVAAQLPDTLRLVAPDLRGRGGSARLRGPFGMEAHASDCVAVLDHMAVDRAPVVGMSMGGYVAVTLAATHPERVTELVLVDGGLPLPIPEGMNADELAAATLGPALERLRRTFPSRQAYHDFWRQHSAFADVWNEHVEAYVEYDLEGVAPELRSKVSEEAVVADSRDVLTNGSVRTALTRVRCPVRLIRAERGLLDQPTPLNPDFLVEEARKVCPQLDDELVGDTNHYTVVLGDRGAGVVAQRITESVAALMRSA